MPPARFQVLLLNCLLIILPVAAATHSQPNSIVTTPVFVKSDASKQRHVLQMKTLQLLSLKKYGELDALERSLISKRVPYPNGEQPIDQFFHSLQDIDDSAPDEKWQSRIREILNWTKQSPKSEAARIAMADTLVSYAWKARTSRTADLVSPERWQVFEERIAQAQLWLDSTDELPIKCPRFYTVAEIVARAQGKDSKKYYDDCVRRFPDYQAICVSRATTLLPRWFGNPGDTERLLKDYSEKFGSTNHNITYARLVWRLTRNMGFRKGIFKELHLDYETLCQGFEDLMKQYPQAIEVPNEYAKIAFAAGDDNRARRLFAQISQKVDPEVWTTLETFSSCWNWSLTHNRSPKTTELFQQGQDLFKAKKYAEAISFFDRAIALNPQLPHTLGLRGESRLLVGNYTGAISDLTESLALVIKQPCAYANRGIALCRLGEIEAALDDFSEANKIDPDYAKDLDPALRTSTADLMFNKGLDFYKAAKYAEAIKCFTTALSLDSSKASYLRSRAAASKSLQQFDRSIADSQLAIRLEPTNAENYFVLAETYASMENWSEASEMYEKALQIDPNYPNASVNLAIAKQHL